jgi:hypothetical protein
MRCQIFLSALEDILVFYKNTLSVATFSCQNASYKRKKRQTMKKPGEYQIYSFFSMMIVALLVFEVLISKESAQKQWTVTDIPEIDRMYIDFPCKVFITKSEEEAIVFEGSGKLVKQISMDGRGRVLHLTDVRTPWSALLNKVMPSAQAKPNLYIRIGDPGKIVPSEHLTVVTSESLSQHRSGLLSNLRNLKQLITSTFPVG